jgi:hypothetical protein
MNMTAPNSTHQPFEAGAIVEVTGDLIVDTSLRQVQMHSATLAAVPTATDCIVGAELLDEPERATKRLHLYVMAADGVTPGVTATKVSWRAHGK